jgi:DNA gyrase subunit A
LGTEVVNIIEESRTRYLTYAMSVVTSRAIPDVRDGLKPVQRRIIYAMLHNLSLLPNKNFRKSAAVVGEVLGRYHPHGDSACYEAMVRMAQDFSLRYPLVEGQGNFGSLDGDSAAAYRYTEAKLRPLALELLGDIDDETVPFRDNFDQTTKEPLVFPSKIPNLLMNGVSGIAVGMATSIPPHNLTELCDALVALVENPDLEVSSLLKYVKGPDFPTACEILNSKSELNEIYTTGRGSIRMRATYRIELDKPKGAKQERKYIVFDSIPYGIDKSTIVEKIADVVIQKKLTQVEDVRDESTEVVRIVVEIAREAEEEKLLAYLFKSTPLQSNFSINFTLLIPGNSESHLKPAVLNLKETLGQFLTFRRETYTKSLQFELKKLEERVHVLEGIQKIIDILDAVIKEVRKSASRSDAIARLVKVFDLSERQAEFVVDLRIYQLTKTNLEEILSELSEKQARIKAIQKILASEKLLNAELVKDITRIRETYGDKRKCKVVSQFETLEVSESDLIADEEVYVILTKDGWLKRIKSTNDPSISRLREGDQIIFSAVCSTKDTLLLLSNQGTAFSLDVYSLPATTGYGEPYQKLCKSKDGESIVQGMIIRQSCEEMNVLVLSRQGLGYVSSLNEMLSSKKNGKRILKLKEGDSLLKVCAITDTLLVMVSENGYCLCLHKDEVPTLGIGAKGVQLMKVTGGDLVADAVFSNRKSELKVQHNKGDLSVPLASFTLGKRALKGDKLSQKKIGVVERIING